MRCWINCIAALGLLVVASPGNGQVTLLDTFGTIGTGSGQFNQPLGVTVAPNGSLYVVDSLNNRIQSFTQAVTSVSLSPTSTFGAGGAGNGQFNFPTDIAAGPGGALYVADLLNDRVQSFSSTGAYQSQFGATGSGNGQFNGPSGVAVGPGGIVAVADSGNNRGQVFSSAGVYQSQFGNVGPVNQQVGNPAGVTIASDGTRYLADTNGGRVQSYFSDGSFNATIGSGTLSIPIDMSVAPSGDLYVADAGTNRVHVFSSTGTLRFDLGDGLLNSPSDVVVAPTGQIFVSDTLNHRVARWFNPAEWVSGFNTFATPTAGAGQLLGQQLTLNPPMMLNSLTSLTVNVGGSIIVNGGTLNSTGTVQVSGTLTVRAGSTATSTGMVTIAPGGLLDGNGTLAGPVIVAGTIRPGETGIATLRTGALTLAPGGRYDWSIQNATGTPGSDWGLLQQVGANALTITATSSDPFVIEVTNVGSLADFNPNAAHTWTIATYGSISGFAANKFTVDTTNLNVFLAGGSLGVIQQGNSLAVSFTPVPEPASIIAIAAVGFLIRRVVRRPR